MTRFEITLAEQPPGPTVATVSLSGRRVADVRRIDCEVRVNLYELSSDNGAIVLQELVKALQDAAVRLLRS